MTTKSLADLRRDYAMADLRRKDLLPDPLEQFQKWFAAALEAQVPEPNAMTLATTDGRGQPSARTVLLKGLDPRGFVFFTNYDSPKAHDLEGNPRAALLFHWRELERQVSIRGLAAKVSGEESEAYFKSRPLASKLAAWASNQSEKIPNRGFLEKKLAEVSRKYPGEDVPVPPYWGGYAVTAETMEFWQGGPGRLHDRFCYTRQSGGWVIERLSP